MLTYRTEHDGVVSRHRLATFAPLVSQFCLDGSLDSTSLAEVHTRDEELSTPDIHKVTWREFLQAYLRTSHQRSGYIVAILQFYLLARKRV